MTLRSLQFGIYTLVIISTINFVGSWAEGKLENTDKVNTRTEALCKLDTSYCK